MDEENKYQRSEDGPSCHEVNRTWSHEYGNRQLQKIETQKLKLREVNDV